MTCDPASSVPDQPSNATFHASGPRFTRNSETMPRLSGGRNSIKSLTISSKLALPPMRVVAKATAINNAGKNARKRLNAMACEIMLHLGKTRVNMPKARFTIGAKEIICGIIPAHVVRSQLSDCDKTTARCAVPELRIGGDPCQCQAGFGHKKRGLRMTLPDAKGATIQPRRTGTIS